MLSIKELSIKDYQHDIILVNNLSFTLKENDKIAIIGSEGSGKSTLLKIIKGYSLPFASVTGEIIKPPLIFYLEQNIKDVWGNYTVFEYLEIDNSHIYAHISEISKFCIAFDINYDQIIGQQINTLSGGEAVKIGLIKALITEPDILLLDEPSNDLDFKTLLFLELFLQGTTIPTLFISHDQRLLENVATGIIHLQQVQRKSKAKSIFLNIDYQTYKERFINKFNSDLLIARKQRADYDKKMEKFRQIYQSVEYAQNQAVRDPTTGRLLKKRMHVLKSQEKRYAKEKEEFVEIPVKEEPMNIFFQNTVKTNKNKRILDLDIKDFILKNSNIIKEVKLTVFGQDKLVITGNNGSGKTTLLEFIYHHLKNNGLKVGYLSQDYLKVLNVNQSPVEYLLENQITFNESRIRQILGTLGLKTEESLKRIKDLSEGTKLKVLLLLLSANDYEVILLDEPTRNISPLNQDEIYHLFASFNGALIAVSHDRTFIESVFDEIYELTAERLIKS